MGKILSIEIDSQNIKILEGIKKDSILTVHKNMSLETPLNSIVDGKIMDMDAVVKVIKNTLETNKIKTKNAIIIINTNAIITRNIELPLLKKKKEILSMIKNELAQLLSVDLNQYKLIYKQIEKFKVGEIEKSKYIVYGLPIVIYQHYIELINKLNLQMIALDLSLNSLDKIVKHNLTINGEIIKTDTATAFIRFGFSNITFSVVNNGINDFSRISTNGVKDIIKSLEAIYGMTEKEAFDEICSTSLIESSTDLHDISKLNIIQDSISLWIDEFNRYIRYYNSLNKDRQIGKIYIYGNHCRIKDLQQYLTSRLNTEVEIIQELSGVTTKGLANDKFNILTNFNVVLSLYIGRKDINFLTDKNKMHKTKFRTGVIFMAVALVVILTIGYYAFDYFVEQISLQKEIDSNTKFITDEQNIKLNEESITIQNKVTLLQNYKKEVDKLKTVIKNEDVVTTLIFKEIKEATPKGTKINMMAIDEQSIQLQCMSISKLEVAQFEKNLKEIEFINHVYIPAVVKGADDIYSYSVACELKDVTVDEAE